MSVAETGAGVAGRQTRVATGHPRASLVAAAVVALTLPAASIDTRASAATDHESRARGDAFDRYGRLVSNAAGERVNYLLARPGMPSVPSRDPRVRSVMVSEWPPEPPRPRTHEPSSTGAPTVTPTVPFVEEWRAGIFGSNIGSTGIAVVDLDGDGELDIVAGGSTGGFGSDDFFYVLRYDPIAHGYTMRWVSDLLAAGIGRIAVFDTENDGDPEIYVGLLNGDLRIFDGKALVQKSEIAGPDEEIRQILLADADNDGSADLVIVTPDTTYLRSPITHALERQIPYGASDARVGNVDDDADLELVLANGLVLDQHLGTLTVDWTYPPGTFGARIELVSLDADPALEIVGAEPWVYITAFDAALQSPLWQINTSQDIDAFRLFDVAGDATPEIVYGDGQWGSIHCLDLTTHDELWSIENPGHGVTDLAVADTDGDGQREVLWGADASSSGPDHLYVHEIPSLAFEWSSPDFDGPFTAVDVGDVDGDGFPELAVATTSGSGGNGDGAITLYDGVTHAIRWRTAPDAFGGYAWTGIHAVKIGDLDGVGAKEVLVGTDVLFDGALYVLDGGTGTVVRSYVYDSSSPIVALAVGDVNGDSDPDVVMGGARDGSGSPGAYVYVADAATGAVKWHSINLGPDPSSVGQVKIANVDADANAEIVAINDWAFVFDGVTHVQWQSPAAGYVSMDVADVSGDGKPDAVLGTSDGKIVAFDGTTHAQILSRSIASGEIDGVAVADVDGTDGPDVVFANGGRLGVYSIAADSLSWQSQTLGNAAGVRSGLAVADVDADRRYEIVVATEHSLVEFQGPYVCSLPGPGAGLNDPCAIFTGTFDAGDLSGWSAHLP